MDKFSVIRARIYLFIYWKLAKNGCEGTRKICLKLFFDESAKHTQMVSTKGLEFTLLASKMSKNKAIYTATEDACGWAGALIEKAI